MVMKKEVLICKCKKLGIKSEKSALFEECECSPPKRKERIYHQVILQAEDN